MKIDEIKQGDEVIFHYRLPGRNKVIDVPVTVIRITPKGRVTVAGAAGQTRTVKPESLSRR